MHFYWAKNLSLFPFLFIYDLLIKFNQYKRYGVSRLQVTIGVESQKRWMDNFGPLLQELNTLPISFSELSRVYSIVFC